MLTELIRALWVAPWVERLRRGGPKRALKLARDRGLSARPRGESGRARLRRAIAAVDRRWPSGANCYRRVLLEIALDPDAAAETVHLGFRLDDTENPGHAWLGDEKPEEPPFDTVVRL